MSATPDAQHRIDLALIHIEAAQTQLGKACAELATLRHGAPEWKTCRELYGRVHAFWYRVRNMADGKKHISTDREPEVKP